MYLCRIVNQNGLLSKRHQTDQTNTTNMPHDVFISYSSKDKPIADAVCHFLEADGIKCWIAPRDIPPGSDYADLIEDAIKNAKLFIIIFSNHSSCSQWVKSELNIAFTEQRPIIPFKIDEAEVLGSSRLILSKIHWIDAYPEYESKLAYLVESAKTILKKDTIRISGDSQQIKDQDSHKSPRKRFGSILISIIAVIIIALGIAFYLDIPHKPSSTTMCVNGIVFPTEKLSESQVKALESILNGMRFVENGTFIMGNPQKIDDENMRIDTDKYSDNTHTVTLDSFMISSTELTQNQLSAFMDIETLTKCPGPDKPVDYLSWEQCRTVADTLKALTGINFDLPTEAQWEYAARGGRQGVYRELLFAGADDPLIVGWILSENSEITAHNVGLKQPNELGLYDMTGNVAEWCKDSFAPYPVSDVSNPLSCIGENKVIRGGSAISDRNHAKLYTREQWPPSFQRSYTGMRLVINLSDAK